ncbi:hypothetical protein DP23_4345 [Ralstonia pickettii]|nr:hypothetical protein DP23_4345 [Ralstonia pickettii]
MGGLSGLSGRLGGFRCGLGLSERRHARDRLRRRRRLGCGRGILSRRRIRAGNHLFALVKRLRLIRRRSRRTRRRTPAGDLRLIGGDLGATIDRLILDLHGHGIGHGARLGVEHEGQHDHGSANQYHRADQAAASALFLREFGVKAVVIIVGSTGGAAASIRRCARTTHRIASHIGSAAGCAACAFAFSVLAGGKDGKQSHEGPGV